MEQHNNTVRQRLAKKLNAWAWVVTVIVMVLVLMMRRVKIETQVDFSFLPPFHATLNAITALILIYAFIQIRRRNIEKHRKAMYVAIATSALFLLSYVVYHFTTDETPYCMEGGIRIVYFLLLITHIVLAAVIFPFILFTFIRAYTGQYVRHRKMARWVYPVWLYVAITGPVVYLMLEPCYK